MNRKKYIIWLSSFIVMLTVVLFPSESSAKTVSVKDKINNINVEGTISMFSDRGSASTSASTPVSMTVQASYTYALSGQEKPTYRTVSASNSGNSRGIVATAIANHHGPISEKASGTHTWSISGNNWKRTTNVYK